MRPRIALVSARAARALDEDLPPLIAALAEAGAEATVADWDDSQVEWGAFRLALLRSAWDYPERLAEFLAWADRTARLTTLLNPPPVLRWNTDKHYLRALARAGVPVVPTRYIEPAESAPLALASFLRGQGVAEWVVKPAVGAGSRDAARYVGGDDQVAREHIERLLAAGRSVMLQPYLDQIEVHGETALIYFAGRFSHAVRKGPLLERSAAPTAALFAAERITPRVPVAAELEVGNRALAALPFAAPLYARVDLVRCGGGEPCVLELELTEPSLFLAQTPGAAGRFARLCRQVCSDPTRYRPAPR
jgi:hypothetical protein